MQTPHLLFRESWSDRRYVAMAATRGFSSALMDIEFDCVVCDLLGVEPAEYASVLEELCRTRVDWVATCGPLAEAWHDAIDEASVRVGRQSKVGDGSPMSAWHDDATSFEQMAEVARFVGGNNAVCLQLVCPSEAFDGACKSLAYAFVRLDSEAE